MKIIFSLLLIGFTFNVQACREASFSSIKNSGAKSGNGDSNSNGNGDGTGEYPNGNGNGNGDDGNGNGDGDNGNNNNGNGDNNGGGGDGGGGDDDVTTPMTVSVADPQRNFGGEKTQATAVLKDGSKPPVTWTVSAPSGKDPGTIDDKGVYTSPAKGNESYPVTVTAVTKDDDKTTGSTTIILVVPPSLDLIVKLPVTELGIGSLKTQATAELKDGTKNPPVRWSVSAPAGKDAGSIDTNTGVYTSPANGNDRYTVEITAVLIADSDVKDTVPLILVPPAKPELIVTVPVTQLNVGGEKTKATAQLKDGTQNPPVNWTVSAPAGKDPGSIDGNGNYTSPATGNAQYVVTIKATLKADTSVSASVPLNIIPLKPELIVTLPTNEIKPGKVQIPAKAVLKDGTQNPPVKWSVSGPAGKDPGSIDSNGIYTSPEKSNEKYVVEITAVLIADESVKASVPLTILKGDDVFARCTRGNVAFPIVADVYPLAVDTQSLPKDFSVLTKATTVCLDKYDVANREFTEGFPDVPNLFEWFALNTKTTLIVPKAGTYTIRLNSDDGSKLWIDGVLIIDNDGHHVETAKEQIVYFTKAGEYPLVLDYFQGPRFHIALELFWKKPGYSHFEIIPTENFK